MPFRLNDTLIFKYYKDTMILIIIAKNNKRINCFYQIFEKSIK